jgi:lipopolysaccharide exporter
MPASTQRKMASGAAWMVLFKLVERSLGLVSMLILVRLLSPADFGVVAMALSFIFMAEALTAFGFDTALIQNPKATEAHYNTAWTGNLLLGAAITVLMLALAAPIADFYSRPEVYWIVCALAIGPLVTGCENIGVVAFRKELDFRKEFMFQLSRKIFGFLVVVPLAFWLRSYWALVAGMLASRLAGSVMSYLVHPFRPRLSLAQIRSLFHFSRWLLINNMLAFLIQRSTDFFIGRLHGAVSLGVYNVSYEFANLPTSELSAPINRALMPGFAKLSRAEDVRQVYGNAVAILALFALPAAGGIFAVAPYLVPVVLGSKWLESVALIEVLAFNGALLLFLSSLCSVLIGRGHPARVMMTSAMYVVLLLALLGVLSVRLGVIGAAYAALAASLLSTPIYLYQLHKALAIGPAIFLRAIVRPAFATVFMAAMVRWALPEYQGAMSSLFATGMLLSGVLLGILTYVVGAAALWLVSGRPAGPERVVFDRVRVEVSRRFTGRFKRASK